MMKMEKKKKMMMEKRMKGSHTHWTDDSTSVRDRRSQDRGRTRVRLFAIYVCGHNKCTALCPFALALPLLSSNIPTSLASRLSLSLSYIRPRFDFYPHPFTHALLNFTLSSPRFSIKVRKRGRGKGRQNFQPEKEDESEARPCRRLV
jgi:hypothetical protein